MANKKSKKMHGGLRDGAGRTGRKFTGGTAKICVSVTADILQTALKNWHGTRSNLVDYLLRKHVATI
jgi:hypothetical protein